MDICVRHELNVIESPPGVEIITRGEGEQKVMFLINHTEKEHVVKGMALTPYETIIK